MTLEHIPNEANACEGGRSFAIKPAKTGWRAWGEHTIDSQLHFLICLRAPSGRVYSKRYYHTAAHKRNVQAFLRRSEAAEDKELAK